MSVAAIVPVRGRFSLLVWTLDRLKEVNKVDHVILVGHEEEAQELARLMDLDWVYHPNFPLGMKYNAGWEYAWRKYDPDHYIMMGSGDWMSSNLISSMQVLCEDHELVGKSDKFYYNIGVNWSRLVHVHGVPVGSCSMVPRRVVDSFDGRPFNDTMDADIDWSLRSNIMDDGGLVFSMSDKETKVLSISYHKWSNAYSFDGYWNNKLRGNRLGDGKDWLRDNFRDALEMTLW
jgi:hypothetical protein